MHFETVMLLLVLSKSIKCSLVIDSVSQKGVFVADYCPKMKHCLEGAHIMCMFYNPNSVMGPRCRNARNISMTPDLANKLIDVSNAVRSKIARGKEKGKNGEHLPRGYGIFRLKWDSELATFAQVLANQCVLRHDLCRATKRFPEPGQTAGLVRFSVPDWYPVSKSGNFSNPGLSNDKLLYATTQTLKSWYGQKSSVTVQMLTNYPDWTKDPNRQQGRLYLEMIYGPSTHMGCGISAYTEYAFYDNDAALNYNSIQIICNYSARPRTGGAVYNTVPPSDTDTNINACGCPAGSVEDDDCLCNEVVKKPEKPVSLHEKSQPCPIGMNCDPTVVLLPIFTVEDAPPEKLISPERFANSSLVQMGRMDAYESLEDIFHHTILENAKKNNQGSSKMNAILNKLGPNGQKQIGLKFRSPSIKINGKLVRNRKFGKQSNGQQQEGGTFRQELTTQGQKSSIFAKSPRFELPGHNYFSPVKRKVTPRKDFSAGKKLVGQYLYDQRNVILPKESQTKQSQEDTMSGLNALKSIETVRLGLDNDFHSYTRTNITNKNKINHEDVHFNDILTTETFEGRIMNRNNYMTDMNITHDYDRLDVDGVTEEGDNKLLALLDTLEQEVKHIALRDKDKKIFDAKIKKIYGKVVGKPGNTLSIKDTTPSDLGGEFNEYEKESYDRNVKRSKEQDSIFEDYNSVHKLEPPHDKVSHNNNFDNLPYYRRGPHNIIDIETEDFSQRPIPKKRKALMNYDKRGTSYIWRNRNNIRQRNHNEIVSPEHLRNSDNQYRRGATHKNNNFRRNLMRTGYEKPRHRSNSLDYKKTNYDNPAWNDDPLSVERRKYYQDKLDNMERKLKNVRRVNHRKDPDRPRHLRAMRTRSENQMSALYKPGARFLHGY